MNYTILAYETQDAYAARTDPARQQAYVAGWMAYSQVLREAGIMVTGAGLQAPETASTIKLRDGQPQVQDGPYADSKEQLGGFYIINVPDLDTALSWAARSPAAVAGGVVEVRPNVPM
ncbi:YciI family protein [Phyllobacterium pellucidum]|uniref:YciI family protein n=1 Tax=Phyllobacterium pellucidum TaxID=2740464 RepID=UPI001D15DCD2|nr:YciI family protein [Phyllobacterium sp. T1018]UGY09872.1 YciI family protein [Phyllobacterium sp. T1018]